MQSLTTLIAEDEPLARDGLAEWVRGTPSLQLLDCVADGAAALRAIQDQAPQLVLMDIQMPGLTGLQVLRTLAAAGRVLPAVIFTTAYDEHALTAFELHAVDYLLKPFTRERFDEAIQHVLWQRGGIDGVAAGTPGAVLPALEEAAAAAHAGAPARLTRVLVREGGRLAGGESGRIVPISVEAIEHLRSDTKYTAIASGGRSYLVRLPIISFEQRLDPARFLKINRSCIVNLDFVDAMTPDDNSQLVVQLRDGTRVTASREVSKQLRADSL